MRPNDTLRLLLTGFAICAFAFGLVAKNANAQEASAEPNVSEMPLLQFKPETVQVFGRSITVVPFQMEHTDFSWFEVKSYLPPSISRAPEKPMSYPEIFHAIKLWRAAIIDEYQDSLRTSGGQYLEDNPDSEIDNEFDLLNMVVEKIHYRETASAFPVASHQFKRLAAINYLHDMLADAFGYPRLSEGN